MRPAARVVVPLKSMCSSTCERPPPSHLPSSMLPALHQTCAETTGALWSSRMIKVRPFSSVLSRTPGGIAGSDELASGKEGEIVLVIIRIAAAGRLQRKSSSNRVKFEDEDDYDCLRAFLKHAFIPASV